MSAVIELANLTAGYEGVPVVRDLTLSVHAGEIVALLGPNGAGKTTTIHTVAAALPVIGGEARVHGRRVNGHPAHRVARWGVSVVPEGRGLFSGLTVAENLRLCRAPGRKKVDTVLAYFPELAPLLGRRCGLLSGGEQQMLAVGRALAAGSRALMIDEMSLGLAPLIADRILQVIRRIASDAEIGVLLVEQHIPMALSVADRAYLLGHGELIAQGDAAYFLENPELLEEGYLGRASREGR